MQPASRAQFRQRLGPAPSLVRRNPASLAYDAHPGGQFTGGNGVLIAELGVLGEADRDQQPSHSVSKVTWQRSQLSAGSRI